MSWLVEGLEHTSDGSAGIRPDINKGGGFVTSSIQRTRPMHTTLTLHMSVWNLVLTVLPFPIWVWDLI